jgi:GNAT superfamily N-acetyltransferase
MLVNSFLDWCNKQGYHAVRVEASAMNRRGIEFYKKFGFKDHTLILEINPENKRV